MHSACRLRTLSLAIFAVFTATAAAQIRAIPGRPIPKPTLGNSALVKSMMITGPRLSRDAGKASGPSVAVVGNTVWVAYTAFDNATDGFPYGYNLWVTHSDDGGVHFYPAKLVFGAGEHNLISPRIAVQNGRIWVGFIYRDSYGSLASLQISESKDNGASFSTPYVVEPAAGFYDAGLNDNGFNYMAVAGGAAFCAWADTDGNVYMWKEGGGPVIRLNPEITIGSGRGVTRAAAVDAEIYANGNDVFVPYSEAGTSRTQQVATFPDAGRNGPLTPPAATIQVGSSSQGRVQTAVDGESLLVAYTSYTGFNVARVANWKNPASSVADITFNRESNAVPVPIRRNGDPPVQVSPASNFQLTPAPGGTVLTWTQGWNIQQAAWRGFIPSGSNTMPTTLMVTKSYWNTSLAASQLADKTVLFFPDTVDVNTTSDRRLYASTVGAGSASPAREIMRDPTARYLTLVTVGDHMLAFWRSGDDAQSDLPILWAVVNP
jgi:hypothetical protein